MIKKLLILLLLPFGAFALDVDALIERARDDFHVPGIAVAIVADGAVFAEGYGYRDVEQGLPVTRDTLFAIGSCTKAFTAFAVSKLVEEDLLDLDAPVIDTIPEFRLMDAHTTRHVTTRDLLAHRTGLGRHDLVWHGGGLDSPEDMLSRLRHLERVAQLRERFQYNNLMYAVAGQLIERLRGHTWEEEVQRLILDPLQMNATNFSVEASQQSKDFALPYKDGKRTDFYAFRVIGAAGSINSSAKEMADWVQLQLNQGTWDGATLLSPRLVREMHTPQLTLSEYPSDPKILMPAYALGWGTFGYRGHHAIAHSGGINGFTAHTLLLPQDGVGVVILANQEGSPLPELLAFAIVDHILGVDESNWLEEGLAEQREERNSRKATRIDRGAHGKTQASHPLTAYAGVYAHPGYGTVEVRADGEGLVLAFGSLSVPLSHLHYDVFITDDDFLGERTGAFTFRHHANGAVSELVAKLDLESEAIVFTRAVDQRLYDPAFLKRFESSWRVASDVLDIKVEGDKLVLEVRGEATFELAARPNFQFDLKGLNGYQITFDLDESDAVTGMRLTEPGGVYTGKPVGGQR